MDSDGASFPNVTGGEIIQAAPHGQMGALFAIITDIYALPATCLLFAIRRNLSLWKVMEGRNIQNIMGGGGCQKGLT